MTHIGREPGRRYRFEKYEFYAHDGMITLIDTEEQRNSGADYTTRIAPGEFMRRAIASMTSEPDKYPSKLRKLRKLLEDAKTACLLAKKQGDPTDGSVLDHVVRHKRRSSALILPGDSPDLPAMPGQRFKFKPKGDVKSILSKGVDVVPDIVIDPHTVMTPSRAAMSIQR